MNNLRKLLNFPTKKQRKIIENEIALIMKRCNVIANTEFNEQKNVKKSHDQICPLCQSDNVVNKFALVQGKNVISTVQQHFFNKSFASIDIDTHEVNHCNICNNEWKKFKLKYVSKTDIVGIALNYLFAILNDDVESTYEWKINTIKVFDDCHVESILKLIKTKNKQIHDKTKKQLTRKLLEKQYPSIY